MARTSIARLSTLAVALLLAAVPLAACGTGDDFEGAGGGPAPSQLVPVESSEDSVSASRRTALLIAKDIAAMLTPEMGQAHARLVKTGSRQGEEFRVWRDFLLELRDRYDLTSLYTMVRIDKETVGLVLEVAERPGDIDRWMTPYLLEPAMKKALSGKRAVSREPWFDPHIRSGAPHIRALAPVLDDDEKVVALIGFDMEVGDQRVQR